MTRPAEKAEAHANKANNAIKTCILTGEDTVLLMIEGNQDAGGGEGYIIPVLLVKRK